MAHSYSAPEIIKAEHEAGRCADDCPICHACGWCEVPGAPDLREVTGDHSLGDGAYYCNTTCFQEAMADDRANWHDGERRDG